jgi:hypothetical protein
MKIVTLTTALTIAGLLTAAQVMAQPTSTTRPQTQEPALTSPGGVAGGFASTDSKDAATKQKAQTLTPGGNQDTMQDGKQK